MAIGKFDNKKNEYIITNMFPRRELKNYLWNNDTLCVTNQFLDGTCWTLKDSVKTVIDQGERNLYIKDNKTGEVFCANRNYSRVNFDTFECHVGLGYQQVVSEYLGIKSVITMLLPTVGHALLFKIQIENVSKEDKDISIYFYNQPTPNESTEDCYTEGDRSEEFNGVKYIHEAYSKPYYTRYYVSSMNNYNSFAVANDDFIGAYGNKIIPDGIHSKKLSSTGINFDNNIICAFQFNLSLQTDDSWENYIAVGVANDDEECNKCANYYIQKTTFDREYINQIELNQKNIDVFKIETKDQVLNAQTNVWLKRQLSLGKDWGRVYGKGFRDVMQDIASFTSLAPELARERIIDVLKWQYEDGNPIRMFDPCFYYPYNDCGSWIPATILQYINESGDISILDEEVPYLTGTSKEKSGYNLPIEFKKHTPTNYTNSVFEHLKKSVDYLIGSVGSHGLVLLLGGDWNDSLNSAGKEGKGESVWLTLATIKCINEFIEVLKILNKNQLISIYEQNRDVLINNVLSYGIDGDHLIYGYNDNGEKIGAESSQYGKIYLNPQTWAVLANLADKKLLERFMDEAENRLKCDYGYMQLTPCYQYGDDSLGRITYFKNGIVENGAVYNHGVAFKIVADCILGRADLAYETLLRIRYDNKNNENNGMEPYAISNFYIGPENKYVAGFAPMSWITGTAGWVYRAITEYICGVKPTYYGLKIQPCISKQFDSLKVERIFRNQKYHIEYTRGQDKGLFVNGKKLDGDVIEYNKDIGEYTVKVVF